jgi:hypothetical protein
MALWQFDLHLLPRSSLLRRYNSIPIRVPRADFDDFDWWRDARFAANRELGSDFIILPETKSWSPFIRTWGDEDGDRVDLCFKENLLEAFFVRIDVRNISVSFLSSICKIAVEWDCLLLLENDLLVSPSVSNLMTAIRPSRSFRFVLDPEGFIAMLAVAD